MFRPTLVYIPNDTSDITLIVEHGETSGDGAAWSNVTAQRGGALPDFSTMSDETGYTNIEWTQGTLEVNVGEVGNGALTNIMGTRRVKADSAADIDGTDLPIFAAPGNTDQKQFSNELRWAGSFSDRWEATLGLYYFKQDIGYREARYQRELNVPDPDVIVLQGTINAGDVTITGVEVDFVALISDSFSINASYGWQDGEYDSVNAAFAGFLGSELPRLAPTNYNVGFSWDIPVGSGMFNVIVNHSFRESHPYDDANQQHFDDQRRTNASLNWFSSDDAWNVSLYGKNLEDEANWGNLTSIAGLWVAGPMKKGRVLGLEINYRR